MNNLNKVYNKENENTNDKLNYFKSPMNYLGNKYKLLPQIVPLLPDNIDTFYDVFCGGLDISLNVKANKVIANDKHEDLIWLYNEILKHDGDSLGDELSELDKKHFPMNITEGKALRTWWNIDKDRWNELMDKKRIEYYRLRDDFNEGRIQDFRIALLLMLNNVGLVEFRVVNRYITFACGTLRVNKEVRNRFNSFKSEIKNLSFSNDDFRTLKDIQFNDNNFVYLDPPYIGTTQYKTRWTEKDEQELYSLLDYLNNNGIKFALSNFADGSNHTNDYLAKWCGKYNIHNIEDKHFHLEGISKKGKRQEILVTNY